ncbi:ATP synthase F1 subunit delta [Candidatus Dojkabacteria bacterium]|nr:ATP synthase F1 subunit delta [Candidatus Dojkabacteria bacterium]
MTVDEYAKILFKLINSIKENEHGVALDLYMELLIRKKVVSKIDLIIEKYKKLSDEAEGYKNVEVTLAGKPQDNLKMQISELLGQKASYKLKSDPNIIGGVIIEDGNMIYDASVKTQLDKLKIFLD